MAWFLPQVGHCIAASSYPGRALHCSYPGSSWHGSYPGGKLHGCKLRAWPGPYPGRTSIVATKSWAWPGHRMVAFSCLPRQDIA
jgi:hypothetical protein